MNTHSVLCYTYIACFVTFIRMCVSPHAYHLQTCGFSFFIYSTLDDTFYPQKKNLATTLVNSSHGGGFNMKPC